MFCRKHGVRPIRPALVAPCPGYLKLHIATATTPEIFWCMRCDEAAR
jgi:hypothetical protein